MTKEIIKEVKPGVVEKFLQQLPERAFHSYRADFDKKNLAN